MSNLYERSQYSKRLMGRRNTATATAMSVISASRRPVAASLAFVAMLLLPITAAAERNEKLLAVGDESDIAPVARDEVICFALYTVQDETLKLSAHLYPLEEHEVQEVRLDVMRDGAWREIARTEVHAIGWTALFRVENWDSSRDMKYRVRHAGGSSYEGLIRRDPADKQIIVAAAFTGNSPGPGGGMISKQDVVENILKIDPDVLLFTGDQVYNHRRHTEHWLRFGETFGRMMRDRPTVCLPDDHDVGQGNLWGGGGRKVDLDTKGGYVRPVAYVKLVERQQTSHLPDPFNPTPIEQGIGVYYTSLNVGGIDFALVEDRKFKSGCFGIITEEMGARPDHVEVPGVDPAQFDLPDKQLLGERQLRFLDAWGQNWDGTVMKAVVSQTALSMLSTYHSRTQKFYFADFDANGWPQTGRNKAIDAMRRAFAFHICGDQHLGTLAQYGIDDWRDAGWSFCVPSIANLYPRWWIPKQEGKNAEPGADEHTGDYLDGFGNRATVYAHTNPRATGREPAELHDRMPGFGIVRFDKHARTITAECWPRMIDVTDPESRQYTGWPRTIHQMDNYGKAAVAWLPEVVVTGVVDPVVQVIDERDGQVVYTVRVAGERWRPKVFRAGTYTIHVGEGERRKTYTGVKSVESNDRASRIEVDL